MTAVFPFLLTVLFLTLLIALPILLGVYVYRDATRRGMNAVLWTLLAVFAPGLVGLIIYLLVRNNYSDATCQKCGKPVRESFAVCPHCGTPLKEHCGNCNGILESGWSNCPHCGTPIPEEQKKVLSRPPKKDKGLTRLLLLLIAIPFVLCILLILAVGMFKFDASSQSQSYTAETDIVSAAADYPFLDAWTAECDAKGTGIYVTSNKGETTQFFIYRNDGYYSAHADIKEPGLFASEGQLEVTFSHKYNAKYFEEIGEEMPTYTLFIFESTGQKLKDTVKIYDADRNELSYQ